MRLRLLVISALALIPARAQAADILELLKTHKIVMGEGCTEPCTLGRMNPTGEIRLADGYLMAISLQEKGGYIYPINAEEDILKHPLMQGYFARSSVKQFRLLTKSEVSGGILTYSSDSAFGSNSQQPIKLLSRTKIEIAENTCAGRSEYIQAHGTHRIRFPCAVVALTGGSEDAGATGWRRLNFVDVKSSQGGRYSESFDLVNDRLYYNVELCKDSSWLSMEFEWKGGPLSGSHKCQGHFQHNELSYSTSVKVDGERRHLSATGAKVWRSNRTTRVPLEFDIRVTLEGKNCRIEKFHYRNTAILSADAKTRCYLD
ncbi:MAG: hypothetical protein AB7V13_13820 [Pseudorhodoplanes sp.]